MPREARVFARSRRAFGSDATRACAEAQSFSRIRRMLKNADNAAKRNETPENNSSRSAHRYTRLAKRIVHTTLTCCWQEIRNNTYDDIHQFHIYCEGIRTLPEQYLRKGASLVLSNRSTRSRRRTGDTSVAVAARHKLLRTPVVATFSSRVRSKTACLRRRCSRRHERASDKRKRRKRHVIQLELLSRYDIT